MTENDWKRLDTIHAKLMAESALYRTAYKLKLVGLVSFLQLKELDGKKSRR
jgi:hypothetical protein